MRWISLIAVFSFVSSAQAQNLVDKSFPTQLFEPAIGTGSLLTVEPGTVTDHLSYGFDFLVNYQNNVFSLAVKDNEKIVLVDHQLTTDLVGALGLHYKWLRAQLGFGLPFHVRLWGNEINQQGKVGETSAATTLGDLRLQLKVGLLSGWKGLSIALSPIITVPTGCLSSSSEGSCAEDGNFGGDPNPTLRPRLVFDYHTGNFLFAANLGWLFRFKDSVALSTKIGDQLLYSVGIGYQAHPRAQIMAEAIGRVGFSATLDCRGVAGGTEICPNPDETNIDAFPLELAVAGRFAMGKGFSILVGWGVGLIRGIGSPQFRVLAGVRWAPGLDDVKVQVAEDTDHDGIPNNEDKCPLKPEDLDSFEDKDGCPDLDNDADGVLDKQDKCPLEPEDQDSFEDTDGCPEADNDGDGISDQFDYCPMQPETKNGYKDDDGCPDTPDKDGDGVPDSQDKCVDQKETINGIKDDDGCPDKGKGKVSVEKGRIDVAETIQFVSGKPEIKSRSNTLLDQVVLTLKANQQIKGIRIEGHAGQSRSEKIQKLWQHRVETVRDYLVQKGIDPSRLSVVGERAEKLGHKKSGIVFVILEEESEKPRD
ncbi:MAG: OmpA family protein [Pseudomonadota bacterium]